MYKSDTMSFVPASNYDRKSDGGWAARIQFDLRMIRRQIFSTTGCRRESHLGILHKGEGDVGRVRYARHAPWFVFPSPAGPSPIQPSLENINSIRSSLRKLPSVRHCLSTPSRLSTSTPLPSFLFLFSPLALSWFKNPRFPSRYKIWKYTRNVRTKLEIDRKWSSRNSNFAQKCLTRKIWYDIVS